MQQTTLKRVETVPIILMINIILNECSFGMKFTKLVGFHLQRLANETAVSQSSESEIIKLWEFEINKNITSSVVIQKFQCKTWKFVLQ